MAYYYYVFEYTVYREFKVESAHFPGQSHTWCLTSWLQYGYERSNELFFKHMAKALDFLIVIAKNRLISNRFSVKNGFKSVYRSFIRMVDMVIGLPAMSKIPYGDKLVDKENKFLVAELVVDVCI